MHVPTSVKPILTHMPSPPPQHAECPPITLPKNSKVSRLDTTDNKPRVTKCGERVEIDCFGGYKLIEAGIATCQPDGTYTWLGGTPAYCRRLNWT